MQSLLRRISGLFARQDQGNMVLVADGTIATVELARRVLASVPGVRAIDMSVGPAFYADTRASDIDVNADYVLVRSGDLKTYGFAQRLVAVGLPYAYVIDDNFWMLLDDRIALHAFYQNPLVRRSLEYTIAHADVVLCHSEHFQRFLKAFNPNVVVVPTMFDFSTLQGVKVGSDSGAGDSNSEIRIGVVANSSRSADVALLAPAIRQVLQARPEVVFEFFGFTPPELEGVQGVRSLPHVADYAQYIKSKVARGWLLALAPLVANRFAEYKTNNKLREFGACSLAAIYSDAAVYRECVQDGVTGWVVPNETRAWVDAILVALADPDKTRQIGREAFKYVQTHHQLLPVAARWSEALRPTLDKRKQTLAAIQRAQAKVRRWDRGEVDSPQIFASNGPTKTAAAGEQEGFFRRDVLLMLKPGESVSTVPLAPLAGPYAWSMIVATFARSLTGGLRVSLFEGERSIAVQEHDLSKVEDGETIRIRCEVPPSRDVRVVVANGGSGEICLYAVGSKSTTTFVDCAATYPMGFAA
jgi:glycosyltransferase involved in cell wall biosynthesis